MCVCVCVCVCVCDSVYIFTYVRRLTSLSTYIRTSSHLQVLMIKVTPYHANAGTEGGGRTAQPFRNLDARKGMVIAGVHGQNNRLWPR